MATLKISEKNKVRLIICNSLPTIWCKDCENWSSGYWDTLAPNEKVHYDTKLVAMVTSLEELEKLDRIDNIHTNTFHLVKKIVQIGPVDPALFKFKKRKKLRKVKYIARSAGLSRWLNKTNTETSEILQISWDASEKTVNDKQPTARSIASVMLLTVSQSLLPSTVLEATWMTWCPN